ncbi:hypothetical protein [Ensifer sp. BR816]|uniref:hypothetical protein n=1 Tax=Rhizobium sp. (strain BR816) TaxID=1057002 RepID=UPI0003692BF2|nr:hypothetical protein [Ensifer sp. BR816]
MLHKSQSFRECENHLNQIRHDDRIGNDAGVFMRYFARGDRDQAVLLRAIIDDYAAMDVPVSMIDAFVNRWTWSGPGGAREHDTCLPIHVICSGSLSTAIVRRDGAGGEHDLHFISQTC